MSRTNGPLGKQKAYSTLMTFSMPTVIFSTGDTDTVLTQACEGTLH